MKKGFFQTKIGYQTIAGLITVLAFPLLYKGGVTSNSVLTMIGMVLVIAGMTAAPIITYLHGWKVTEKEEKQG